MWVGVILVNMAWHINVMPVLIFFGHGKYLLETISITSKIIDMVMHKIFWSCHKISLCCQKGMRKYILVILCFDKVYHISLCWTILT